MEKCCPIRPVDSVKRGRVRSCAAPQASRMAGPERHLERRSHPDCAMNCIECKKHQPYGFQRRTAQIHLTCGPFGNDNCLASGTFRFTQRALADLSLSPPTPRLATALVSKVPNKMTRTTPSSRGLWCVNERQKDRLVLHGLSAVPHGELDVNTFLRNSYSE